MKPHAKRKVKGTEIGRAGSPHASCCSSYAPVRKDVDQVVPQNVYIVGWCPILLINDRGKDIIVLKLAPGITAACPDIFSL